jgi:hypothetical protein
MTLPLSDEVPERHTLGPLANWSNYVSFSRIQYVSLEYTHVRGLKIVQIFEQVP